MNKENISTDRAPKAIGPYSQGIEFDNLVYITRATCNEDTDPECWLTSEYNTTNVAEGDSILPDFSICGCDEDDIFFKR